MLSQTLWIRQGWSTLVELEGKSIAEFGSVEFDSVSFKLTMSYAVLKKSLIWASQCKYLHWKYPSKIALLLKNSWKRVFDLLAEKYLRYRQRKWTEKKCFGKRLDQKKRLWSLRSHCHWTCIFLDLLQIVLTFS